MIHPGPVYVFLFNEEDYDLACVACVLVDPQEWPNFHDLAQARGWRVVGWIHASAEQPWMMSVWGDPQRGAMPFGVARSALGVLTKHRGDTSCGSIFMPGWMPTYEREVTEPYTGKTKTQRFVDTMPTRPDHLPEYGERLQYLALEHWCTQQAKVASPDEARALYEGWQRAWGKTWPLYQDAADALLRRFEGGGNGV